MGLYSCIRKNPYFDKSDYKELKSISDGYEADGLSTTDANIRAVNDLIEDEISEYRDLFAEVSAKGGILPFTPDELVSKYLPDPAPEFKPTHNLADGTAVIAGDELNVWVDKDGSEFEDAYATPIKKSTITRDVGKGEDHVPTRDTNAQESDSGRDAGRGEGAARQQTGSVDEEVQRPDASGSINRAQQEPGQAGQPTLSGESQGNQRDSASDQRDSLGSVRSGNASEVPANYRITGEEGIATGGPVLRTRQNIEAIKIAVDLRDTHRYPTKEEQSALSLYVGWGDTGIKNKLFPSDESSLSGTWLEMRNELNGLLTKDEIETAQRSSQYAHYTSLAVIDRIYSALDRFGVRSGAAFEGGVGSGNFIGRQPENMDIRYTGVEMDPMSAAVASGLYPQSAIINKDFQTLPLPQNYYDLIIGNPPFADITVKSDKKYRQHKFLLHDYFLAKQMDALKPGGIMSVVVSKGTMDKIDSKLRDYLNDRAVLLGAIRLPNTAFKENAGTEVVTDILFFQRKTGEEDTGADFTTSEPVAIEAEEYNVNQYFVENPDMVLGKQTSKGSMYGANEYTVEPTGDLDTQLAAAIQKLPEGIIEENPTAAELDEKATQFELATGFKEGSYYFGKDAILRQTIGGVGSRVQIRSKGVPGMTKKDAAIVKDFIGLRDTLRRTFDAMLNNGNWKGAQAGLNDSYDRFVKKHGPINFTREFIDKAGRELVRTPIINAVAMDPDAYRVAAIEHFDINTGEATKGAIFTQNVVEQKKAAEIEAAEDVLKLSLNEKGAVDIDWMAEKYGKDKQDMIDELGQSIYFDPSIELWVTTDQYLSGNVKNKLALAEKMAETDSSLKRNVAALTEVIPTDKTPSQVQARLGAHWIPPEVVLNFAKEILGFEGKISSYIQGNVSSWTVDGVSHNQKYATATRSADKILKAALNKKQLVVKMTVPNGTGGTREITDKEATAAAAQKISEVNDAFEDWKPTNDHASTELTAIYNKNFNSSVPRSYDGSHLTFPRISNVFELRAWQKNTVWRILQRGNTYMAHTVGAGKTLASIVAGMEMRRLGIAKKPSYVVLKSTLAQFSAEFYEAYPDANILVADETKMMKKNRRQFLAQLAMGDWDSVIFTHESFKEISMSDEYVKDYIEAEMTDYRALLEDIDKQDRITRRQIENKIEKLKEELSGAVASKFHELTDFTFEELGIDFLFVDEAHHHKKIPIVTEQGNIKGVPTDGSQRARDLLMKTEYLNTIRPGRHTVLMSGTPITNTMAEAYNIQRYLQPEALAASGISSFDSWSSMFADLETDLEMQPNGSFKPVTRMKRFTNVSALMRDFLQVADIVNDDQLKESTEIERPAIKDDARQMVIVKASPEMETFQKELGVRIKKLENKSGPPQKGEDNILVVIMDGKKAAIDLRLVGRRQSTPSKLDVMIDEVADEWERGKGDVYFDRMANQEPIKGSTQLIFTELRKTDFFDIYDHIKSSLMRQGVPESQIVFIQDFNTTKKKARLFRDFNAGKIRVLIGGSQNLGTGTNVQARGTMLHHLDLDYLPSNVIQREGRYIRSGNKNKSVSLKAYATEGTVDATMWQINESKQRMVDQVMSGNLDIDQVDDVSDSVNQMAMAKALASGNPLVLEQAGLDSEVHKLEALRSAFYDQKFRNRNIAAGLTKEIALSKQNLITAENLADQYVPTAGDKFSGSMGKDNYKDRKAMGEALILEAQKMLASGDKSEKPRKVGSIGGFDIHMANGFIGDSVKYLLTNETEPFYNPASGNVIINPRVRIVDQTDIDDGEIKPLGIISSFENQAKNLSKAPELIEKGIAEGEKKLTNYSGEGGEFQFEVDLREKQERLKEVNRELAADDETEGGEETEGDAQEQIQLQQPDTDISGESARFSKSPDAGDATGVDRGIVESQTSEFLKNLNLNEAIDVRIYDQWQDLTRNLRVDPEEARRANGFIQGNVLHVIAGNLQSSTEIAPLLRHEILAHYGLDTIDSADKLQILKQIVASRDIPFIKQYWDEVSETYGKKYKNRPLKIAEEVFARIAELDPTRGPKIWERIVDMVINALRKVGLFRNTMTRTEARELLKSIAKGITSGIPESDEIRAMDDSGITIEGKFNLRSEPGVVPRWKKLLRALPTKNLNFSPNFPTPDVLREMGEASKQISVSKRVLSHIVKIHPDVPINVIENLPEFLSNPKYVISHKDGGFDLVALNAATKKGEPIIIGVRDGLIKTITPNHNQPGKTGNNRLMERIANAVSNKEKVYAINNEALTEVKASSPAKVRDNSAGSNRTPKNIVFGADIVKNDEGMFNLRPDDPVTASARRKAGLVRETFKQKVSRSIDNMFDVIKTQRQSHIDSWRQGSLDRFHGIKLAQERNFGNIPTEQSPYVAARLSSGISSVMRAILLHGQPKWNKDFMNLEMKDGTKGLLEIFDPVADNIDDFIGWMVGNRAARLMAENRERNLTKDEIVALQALGKGNQVLFKKVAKEFAEFKRSILDVAQQAGLINGESRRIWDNADWIPFYRQMEGDNVMGPTGAGKGLAGKTSGIRTLHGGVSALNDPIENIIMNFHRLLDASLKNNAVQKAIKFAPDAVEKANYEFQRELIPQGEVKRKLSEGGMPEDIIDMMPRDMFKGLAKMWAMKPPTDADVVRVMYDGRPTYYRISDPLLLRAVTSFGNLNFFGLDTARAFKRVLTAAVTATPEFMLRNFIRDTASTIIISRNAVAAAGAFKGLVQAYRESGGAEHMLFAGASFSSGYIDGTDSEATARAVRRSLRKKGMSASKMEGFTGSMVDSVATYWDKYRHISESIENANRQAVFESTFKESGSETAAAFDAKDLMDFSLRGDWPVFQVMADVLPFFNARVQGLYRLGRTNPKQLAIRGALLLAIPSMILALAHLGDDEYESLPDWDKDTYWHFWINGEHFRIPKPFEVGVIFATIPERGIHAIFGEDSAKKFGQRLGWNMAEQLNLVGMPQMIKPAVEVTINYDTFAGRQIENMGDENKSPRLRYNSRTSATMRELINAMGPVADEIGLSPKKAEHLLVGYLGTLGAWGLSMADAGTRMAVGDPARPTLRPDDIPMVKVLYRGGKGTPYYSTQYIQDVYEGAREYAMIIADYKALYKEGREVQATALIEKHKDKLMVLGPMAGAAKAVTAMNKAIDRVAFDRKLTPAQKRKEIDKLLGERNVYAREGVMDSRKVANAL